MGDRFYIVEAGQLGAFVRDRVSGSLIPHPVVSYGAGGYFGELALLRNAPRAATVGVQDLLQACIGLPCERCLAKDAGMLT
jgi:hypothetical protein